MTVEQAIQCCPGTGKPRHPDGLFGHFFQRWFGTCSYCGARVSLEGEVSLPYRSAKLTAAPHMEAGSSDESEATA